MSSPPSLPAPDPTAEDIAAVREYVDTAVWPHADVTRNALAALDRLAERLAATDAQVIRETTERELLEGRLCEAEAERDEARQMLSDYRNTTEDIIEASEAQRDEARKHVDETVRYANVCVARAEAAEAERDEAVAATMASLKLGTEEPPDEVFRFFQRLHDLPEIGGPTGRLAASEARLRVLASENINLCLAAEASEARSAKLEAALREIEKDSSLLGGLVQFSDSPQGTLVGEIRKTVRAALVSSPAAEGEA